MQDISTIVSILWRYKKREQLSDEELIIMQDWLKASEANQVLFDDLSDEAKWERQIEELKKKDSDATWLTIRERIESMNPSVKKEIRIWRYVLAAAVVIGIIIGVRYIFFRKHSALPELSDRHTRYKNDVLPGSNHATLTLDNGHVMTLDSLSPGMQTDVGSVTILKKDSGTLVYSSAAGDGSKETLQYNILTTPGGGEYCVVLPDGSKAWLNAASSLRYPIAFLGNDRMVELTGEAYFEITKEINSSNGLRVPFVVKTGNTSVKVLGTHFNVNAYSDESTVNTTLLEGSVAVTSGTGSVTLSPGQQSRIAGSGGIKIVKADTAQVMAWRHKIFWFKDAPFDEIMKQLSRWYNVDVVFTDSVTDHFSGILPRDIPASKLFGKLESEGKVKFTIEGRKVTISP